MPMHPVTHPAGSPLTVRTHFHGDQVTLTLCGELDFAARPQLLRAARLALRHRPAVLRVDLSGLSFCDCAGLGALLRCGREAGRSGAALVRVGTLQPLPARVFALTGVDTRLRPAPADDGPAALPWRPDPGAAGWGHAQAG